MRLTNNADHPFCQEAMTELVTKRVKGYRTRNSTTFSETRTRHRLAISLGFELSSFWPPDTILKLGAIFLNAMKDHCTLFEYLFF